MISFWNPSFQATQWQTYLIFDLGIILTRKWILSPICSALTLLHSDPHLPHPQQAHGANDAILFTPIFGGISARLHHHTRHVRQLSVW